MNYETYLRYIMSIEDAEVVDLKTGKLLRVGINFYNNTLVANNYDNPHEIINIVINESNYNDYPTIEMYKQRPEVAVIFEILKSELDKIKTHLRRI